MLRRELSHPALKIKSISKPRWGRMSISHCLGPAIVALSKIPLSERDQEIAKLPEACPYQGSCTTGMGCRAYVASLLGCEVESRRRLHDARGLIKRGITADPVEFKKIMLKIAKKRGETAAQQLRADISEQWEKRKEWLEPDAGLSVTKGDAGMPSKHRNSGRNPRRKKSTDSR